MMHHSPRDGRSYSIIAMMKRFTVLALVIIGVGGIVAGVYLRQQKREVLPVTPTETTPSRRVFMLKSRAFENNGSIPERYTCDGVNISPPLTISGVDPQAKSLALIVDDIDTPRGTWVHWLVWNIPPQTTEIAEGALPAGASQGVTGFGENAYGGPCPPSGSHRYIFRLYALDIVLALSAAEKKPDLEDAMNGHVLEFTQLLGRYSR